MNDDPSNLSMLELFRVEAETQTALLTSGLLELEKVSGEPDTSHLTPRTSADPSHLAPLLESLMRAAHSLKGAARIVNLPGVVRVAHAMEDCFVAAQRGKLELRQPHIDVLLRGVDLLANLAQQGAGSREEGGSVPSPQSPVPGLRTQDSGLRTGDSKIEEFLSAVAGLMPGGEKAGKSPQSTVQSPQSRVPGLETEDSGFRTHSAFPVARVRQAEPPDRVLRLTAENLNRLLGLAGESLVESRWLRPFSESMQRLKRMQSDLERTLDGLRQSLDGENLSEGSRARVNELFRHATQTRQFLGERLQELDLFDRRSGHLSNRLYLEVLRTRMRPFSDGTRRFPRMVRDLSRALGKQARLEILGENTQVDRDILDRLETPLAHLLRNAVDHGCETPEERQRAGKPAEGVIRLEARHSAGMLLVTVSDDGVGLDPERLRQAIADKKLASRGLTERMTEAELLQFLFLPGFTLKDTVTELSGRGVGLDIVQNMVKSVRGSVRVSTQAGRGMKFQLHLPLTMSVLRTLLVEVGGEPYAFPLAQIGQTLALPRENIELLEGRQHFNLGDQQVGLLAAHQVFECEKAGSRKQKAEIGRESRDESREPNAPSTLDLRRSTKNSFQLSAFPISTFPPLPIVVLGDRSTRYGLLVDRFLGERELVVQPLDPRLGKVKDISAAALMEDGSPVLIVDVDDLLRSIEKLIASGALAGPVLGDAVLDDTARKRKRILAVDDSLTVRELERKLLESRGYLADVAVNGMDAWNAVRTGVYDLVITDVDMPRLDGIELATLIKRDPHLKSLPVMIVSYKDRPEDRLRGLEAGADYYLTKGSFQDETLLQAVQDLIGEA